MIADAEAKAEAKLAAADVAAASAVKKAQSEANGIVRRAKIAARGLRTGAAADVSLELERRVAQAWREATEAADASASARIAEVDLRFPTRGFPTRDFSRTRMHARCMPHVPVIPQAFVLFA